MCAVAVLGNGRRVVGPVGAGAGFDLYPVARRRRVGRADPTLVKTAGQVALATTDRHYGLEADTEDILRRRTLDQFNAGDHAQRAGQPGARRRCCTAASRKARCSGG